MKSLKRAPERLLRADFAEFSRDCRPVHTITATDGGSGPPPSQLPFLVVQKTFFDFPFVHITRS